MDFDFYGQFSKYSSTDLLEIIRQPEQYQPEALAAAARILSERAVSPGEQQEAEEYFSEQRQRQADRQERLDGYKRKMAEIIEQVVVPGTPLTPLRWYRAFLLTYMVWYAWRFFGFIKGQLRFLHCTHCSFGLGQCLHYFDIVFLSVLLFLIFKRKPWGWILLFAYGCQSGLSLLFLEWEWYHLRTYFRPDYTGPAIWLIIWIALLCFLSRPSISQFFGLEGKAKQWAMIGSVIFAILFVGAQVLQ